MFYRGIIMKDENLYRTGFRFVELSAFYKSYFGWLCNSQVPPLCAYYSLDQNAEPDEAMLDVANLLLQEYSGVFSAFRSNGRNFFRCVLAIDPNPEARMAATAEAYQILRNYFIASDFLPLLALIFSGQKSSREFPYLAEKTYHIYLRMKEQRRLLTGSEDVVYAGLFALRKENESELMLEADTILRILENNHFFHTDPLQSSAYAMTLCLGSAESKCANMEALYESLSERGIRYGRDYELVALSIIANLGISHEQIIEDFLLMEGFLHEQRGYGFFGYGRRTRYLHAMLVLTAYYMSSNTEITTAAVLSVLKTIQRQQAAAAAAAA